MVWKIRLEKPAEKELAKLDHQLQKQITNYLKNAISLLDNPRFKGKALTGNKKGLWRYRVNKYRIICRIKGDVLTILVLQIAKRDVVYDD
jgi:mRNA interferase RelE/StbE